MGEDFEFDDVESEPNVFFLKANNVQANFNGNKRIWVNCDTGICTVVGHNYCNKVGQHR